MALRPSTLFALAALLAASLVACSDDSPSGGSGGAAGGSGSALCSCDVAKTNFDACTEYQNANLCNAGASVCPEKGATYKAAACASNAELVGCCTSKTSAGALLQKSCFYKNAGSGADVGPDTKKTCVMVVPDTVVTWEQGPAF